MESGGSGCWRSAVVGATAAIVSACGGGGGGGNSSSSSPPSPSDPPGAAELSLAIGLKQLRFSWPAVDGATSYQLLSNPDGGSGFTQIGGDIPGGDTGVDLDVSVHLHDWANARYMLDACNSSGCTGSNEVGTTQDDMLAAIGYFKNSNHEAGDSDETVALSADGMTLVIGAPGEDSAATHVNGDQTDNSAAAAGAAYIYRRTDGAWTQPAYLKASNAEAGDGFGLGVAISADGRTIAIGALAEDSGSAGINDEQDDNTAVDAGAVYVFIEDDTGEWSQQAYIKSSNPDANDAFGLRAALSGDGNVLAVAARLEDSAGNFSNRDESDNSAINAGAVYVFRRNSAGDWSQGAYIKASNAAAGDFFGHSLALDGDGDTLAVSAIFEDSGATGIDGDSTDNSALSAGAVYVYGDDSGSANWEFLNYVKAPNTDAFDQFGSPVALSDDGLTLAVAARGEDSSATGVDGDQDDNGTSNSGAAYVYERSGATWTFPTYLKASNTNAGDMFGSALALSGDGDSIAVTAGSEAGGSSGVGGDETDNNVPDAGAAYFFRRDDSSSSWSQRAYVKASNPDDSDIFGSELALSTDGSTLAAISPNEESAATGIGGNQNDNTAPFAGVVYLY